MSDPYAPTDEVAKYISDVDGIVEANSFENYALWLINDRQVYGNPKKEWKSEGFGHGIVVGHVGEMPVFISLLKSEIEGQTILFVDATSQVVDYRMVDAWLEKHMPDSVRRADGYLNKVDANNFHNVLR